MHTRKRDCEWHVKWQSREEENKEENAIVFESMSTMDEVEVRLRFEDNSIRLDEQVIGEATEYKATWRKVKNSLQKATEFKRIEIYKTKEQQSHVYREQEEECHSWLNQS